MNLNISNINNDNNNIQENNDKLINQYIDCCIGTHGSHYDISLTIFEILKNKYRYIGSNNWEYFDNISNKWLIDDKIDRFKYDIRNIVSNYFVTRSIYWDEKSKEDAGNINISIDHQLRSVRLLQCSLKLKDNKYILTLIKEAKQLFNI
jgi:hypothetical protein